MRAQIAPDLQAHLTQADQLVNGVRHDVERDSD